METPRAERIRHIIDKRRPFVGRIESVEANLARLEEALSTLEEERNYLLSVLTEADPVVGSRLRGLEIPALRSRVAAERGAMSKLRLRFARPTLNIGVIGRAGQGKSRLLQSLSGLDTTVIPDGQGIGDVTAVRSTVVHDPNVEPYCDVTFYSEMDFVQEVLRPYYEFLELRPVPRGIEAFATQPLGDLPPHKAGLEEFKTRYAHLQRFQKYLSSYRGNLDQPPRRIAVTDVPQYVTQNAKDEASRYQFLAVREVKIVCRFPHNDIGLLALIDMPGMGNTTIGDVRRMVNILGQDVDVALYVKRPEQLRAGWVDVDVELYDIAASALEELSLHQWALLVLNHAGDNLANCRSLQAEFDKNTDPKFVKSLVANCADPEAVRQQVLDTALVYLEKHIEALDAQYASACQSRLLKLQGETSSLLEDASRALGRSTAVEGEINHFNSLFERIWSDLNVGLEDLRRSRRDRSRYPDERLSLQVQDCFRQSRTETGIASIEEIDRLSKLNGSYDTAFRLCLHKTRTCLVENFLSIEEVLHLALDDARQEVAELMKKIGRLTSLSSCDGTEYLKELARLVPSDVPTLKAAFATIASVNLSYRGFLQYRIRQHLSPLVPDECRMNVAANAQGVRQALEILHHKTIHNLEGAFDSWMCEPNLVAHAIIEEFADRVLRTDDAKEEWRSFYLEMRAQVWAQEFDELGDRSRLRQQWDAAVRTTSDRSRLEAVTFLL